MPAQSQGLVESGSTVSVAGLAAVAFEVAIYQVYAGTLMRFSPLGGL